MSATVSLAALIEGATDSWGSDATPIALSSLAVSREAGWRQLVNRSPTLGDLVTKALPELIELVAEPSSRQNVPLGRWSIRAAA